MESLKVTEKGNSFNSISVEIIEVVKKHFEDVGIIWDLSPLQVKGPKSSKKAYFAEFILTKGLNDKQKLILAAVLLSYTYPTFYYSLINSLPSQKDDAFGCHNDLNTGTTYPTIQTLLFILYGYDFDSYLTGWHELFNDRLFKMGVIETSPLSGLVIKNNPFNHVVSISDDYLSYFFSGDYGAPKFSASFPAQKITTKLSWNDLVLDGPTLAQIQEITAWHKYRDVVLNQWNLNKMLSPGYKVLFHGPPGTGKTLTAAIMGQELGIDVFRIDLSMVVSKYIGETEKKLSALFDRVTNKNWILFFDEADALFGTFTG